MAYIHTYVKYMCAFIYVCGIFSGSLRLERFIRSAYKCISLSSVHSKIAEIIQLYIYLLLFAFMCVL